jgi:hypothetical protein
MYVVSDDAQMRAAFLRHASLLMLSLTFQYPSDVFIHPLEDRTVARHSSEKTGQLSLMSRANIVIMTTMRKLD